MKSIRASLLRAFLVITGLMAALVIILLTVNAYVVAKYQATSETITAEYQLVSAPTQLIGAYNTRVLSSDAGISGADLQVRQIESTISGLESTLDASIVDRNSLADYIGLKNSIAVLISTINTSLAKVEKGGIQDFGEDYATANKQYGFVRDNGTTLIFDQLKYSASLQQSINTLYATSKFISLATFAVILLMCLFYAMGFSRRLTSPLAKLTGIAQRIAAGSIHVSMDAELLGRHDETGSLSNSFDRMVRKLRENIRELDQEKAGVEKKVAERTAELSRERARLSASVSSLPLGFIMTDDKNRILAMNDAAFRLLQLKESGHLDRGLQSGALAGTIADIDEALDGLTKLEATCAKVLEHRKLVRLGDIHFRSRFISLSVSPVLADSSRVLGTVVLLEDMTEERILNRARDEFFSIASHELRTPLTAIRGNSQLLQKYYADKLKDPEFSEMISDIHDSSIRLITIVNDFLDVSHLEQGGIQFAKEAFGLRKVAETVAYGLAPLVKEKGISITLDFPGHLPDVLADSSRTSQIIYNLVGNAIKFTQKGKVEISAKATDRTVELCVTDTGKGISADDQNLLFRKFQQASDSILTRDATEGTGLGLFISRSFARGMGGDVTLLKSSPGEGSTFKLTLPREKGTS